MKHPALSSPTLIILALTLPAAWLAHHLGLPAPELINWQQTLWFLAGAPLIEELVFRWLLQKNLEDFLSRYPVREDTTASAQSRAALLALFITALLFALAHLARIGSLWAIAWFIPGLALADLWRRTRSIGFCIGLHAYFNATFCIVTWL